MVPGVSAVSEHDRYAMSRARHHVHVFQLEERIRTKRCRKCAIKALKTGLPLCACAGKIGDLHKRSVRVHTTSAHSLV